MKPCFRAYPALAGLLAACSSEAPVEFGVRWDEDGIRYHARANDALACRDALAPIRAQRQGFAELFSVSARGENGLDYFKYKDPGDFHAAAGCPARSAACFDGSVHSPLPVDFHELGHAWVRHAIDVHAPIVSEGLATALSCSPHVSRVPGASEFSLDVSDPEAPGYGNAGILVTQALREAAPSALIELARRVDAGARDEGALRDALAAVYSSSPEELRERAARDHAPGCFALGRCRDAPPLELGTTRLAGDCRGVPAARVSSELGAALGLRAVGAHVDVLACAPSAAPFALRATGVGDADVRADAEYLTEAPADPHLLTFTVREPAPEAIVEARPIAGTFVAACPELDATELDSRRPTRLVMPARAFDLYFSLRLSEARALVLEWLGAEENSVPSIVRCSACSSGTPVDCSAVDARQPASVGVVDRLVLRLEARTAPAAGTLLEIR